MEELTCDADQTNDTKNEQHEGGTSKHRRALKDSDDTKSLTDGYDSSFQKIAEAA